MMLHHKYETQRIYIKNIIYKNKSKYSRDIVSEVDKNSERLILNYLISKYKKHNFILEEGENIEEIKSKIKM